MKTASAVVMLSFVTVLAACSASNSVIPGWCGSAPYGVLMPGGSSANPPATPDPRYVQCVAVENRSVVDMVVAEDSGGSAPTLFSIQACSAVQVSGFMPGDGRWALQVGLANPAGLDAAPRGIFGDTLASLGRPQLTGAGPYLITVIINPDLTATIAQRSRLPTDLDRRLCTAPAPPGALGKDDLGRMEVKIQPLTYRTGFVSEGYALAVAIGAVGIVPVRPAAFLVLLTYSGSPVIGNSLHPRPVWIVRYAGLNRLSPSGHLLRYAYAFVDAETGEEIGVQWMD